MRSPSATANNVRSRTHKQKLVDAGYCINGKSHGRRTHGVRCKHCYDVHCGVHPNSAAPIVRDGTEQAFREQGILYKAEMVRAILKGLKEQTRRLVKPQPEADTEYGGFHWPSKHAQSMVDIRDMGGLCPFGTKGDRLWVREGWCHADPEFSVYPDDGRPRSTIVDECGDPRERFVWYRATDQDIVNVDHPERSPWKSPIHLPRWASRITLEVAHVRVERLQDISVSDARAEGVEEFARTHCESLGQRKRCGVCSSKNPKHQFEILWRMIHGNKSWNDNPFVWVITFDRIDREGKLLRG